MRLTRTPLGSQISRSTVEAWAQRHRPNESTCRFLAFTYVGRNLPFLTLELQQVYHLHLIFSSHSPETLHSPSTSGLSSDAAIKIFLWLSLPCFPFFLHPRRSSSPAPTVLARIKPKLQFFIPLFFWGPLSTPRAPLPARTPVLRINFFPR